MVEGWIKGATRSYDTKSSKTMSQGQGGGGSKSDNNNNNNNNNNNDNNNTTSNNNKTQGQDQGLPEGWTEHIDPGTSRTYYYHHPTQTSQWHSPKPNYPLVVTTVTPTSVNSVNNQYFTQHQPVSQSPATTLTRSTLPAAVRQSTDGTIVIPSILPSLQYLLKSHHSIPCSSPS